MSAPSIAPLTLSPHTLIEPPRSNRTPRRVPPVSTQSARIRQVVACLDGSALGRGVIPHARAVSNALGARLTLLHVLELEAADGASSTPADPLDWGIRQREAQGHLDRAISEWTPADSDVSAELIQGRPAEQICHWAENHEVDLTVLCSHGSRGLTEWDLASTARKLIDRIPSSLFLIPATVAAEQADVRYRRILIPLDGSARAESVIPLAMRIATSQDSEVVLIHIVSPPEILRLGLPDAESLELEQRVVEHNQRVADSYLDRLRARLSRSGGRIRAVVVTDGSVRTRLERAIRDEQADLVIMSAHGTTGQLESPCGSVTEYTLTHASTPLLVIRDSKGGRSGQRISPSRARPVERFEAAGIPIS